jgi:hypothetical protein
LVSHHEIQNSVLRKIIITSLVGALTFPLTNLLFDSAAAQFIAAVGVGAVILVIQFLIDFEHRLAAVEGSQNEQTADIRRAVDQGFAKVSAATKLFAQLEAADMKADAIGRLVAQAAAMEPSSSPLLLRFIQTEMNRMTQFLHALGEQEATYNGEDRDWLLGLTRSATTSIDAISTSTVDAGRTEFEYGFWGSDLGQHYLSAQQEAIRRDVRVRRIFVVRTLEHADDQSLLSVCRSQASLGIEVRVLNTADMAGSTRGMLLLHDFILFDDALSYEVMPTTPLDDSSDSSILYTRLVLRNKDLNERMDRFQQFWASAMPLPATDAHYRTTVRDTSQGRLR